MWAIEDEAKVENFYDNVIFIIIFEKAFEDKFHIFYPEMRWR